MIMVSICLQTAEIDTKLTSCGYELLTSENYTIGIEGYLHKVAACLSPNEYAQIGEATFEYNATIEDRQLAHTSAQVSHAQLTAILDLKADRSLLKRLVHHDAPDHETYDLLAEIMNFMTY